MSIPIFPGFNIYDISSPLYLFVQSSNPVAVSASVVVALHRANTNGIPTTPIAFVATNARINATADAAYVILSLPSWWTLDVSADPTALFSITFQIGTSAAWHMPSDGDPN